MDDSTLGSVLQDIPESISIAILANWLNTQDIGRLDSAYCTSLGRGWWLSALRASSRLVFEKSKVEVIANVARESLLDWTMKRNIFVSHAALPSNIESKIENGMCGECLQRLGSALQSIDLIGTRGSLERTLASIALNCSELRWLNLMHFDTFTDDSATSLARCGKLQHLALINAEISGEGLDALSALHELRYLNMMYCAFKPEDASFTSITESNRQLEYVALSDVTSSTLLALANSCRSLQELHIAEFHFTHRTSLTAAFTALVTNCTRLTSLTLDTESEISEEMATAIATHCPQLQSLRCCQLTTADMQKVAAGCTRLTRLDLSGDEVHNWIVEESEMDTDDAALQAVAEHCAATLTYLNIRQCDQVSAEGIKAIAGACSKLQTFKANNSEAITDDGITLLARTCGTALGELDLQGCEQLTDLALYNLAAHCGAGLTSVDVRGCKEVTEAGIAYLLSPADCPNLRCLRCDMN